jgi:glutaredoxin
MSADAQHPTPASAQSADVVLYTRAGCHLCDDAKDVIRGAQRKMRFSFAELDIDRDPELRALFNEEVPVVFVYGRKAFKYQIDPRQLLTRLERGRTGLT